MENTPSSSGNSEKNSSAIEKIKPADLYKAALDHARQLSTLRFAALTVFMTSNAALFSAYAITISQSPSALKYPQVPICVAGCWIAVVFFVCEITLSFTMACQNSVAKNLMKDHPLEKLLFKHRHFFALWPVRLLIPSIYIGAGFYWLNTYIEIAKPKI